MNIKIAAALTFGIVVLAVGALLFWPDLDDEPAASAQEVVESACDSMEKVESYDMATTIKVTGDGALELTGTFKAEVSGPDFRYENTYSDGYSNRAISVGGKDYVRYVRANKDGIFTTKGWEVFEEGVRDVESWLSDLGDTPICPDLSNVTFAGEEDLDGVKTSRYVSGDWDYSQKDAYFNDKTFEGVIFLYVHEYWVDSNGQLLQHRLEQNSVSQGHGTERRVTNRISTTRFLDVGEANTITAPVLGEGNSTSGAQEVVQRSCTELAKNDQYDFSSQAGGSENGVPYPGIIEAKGSVSGKDYYVTNTDYNDQVLEIRQVGNNVYWRQGTDGAWTQRGVQPRIPHDVLGLGETPICPDVTNVIQKGEEDLDGVKTIRYVSGDVDGSEKAALESDSDFQGSKYIYFHEHWIDTGGLLAQHRAQIYLLQQNDPETKVTGRNVSEVFKLTRFFGIGEPNTITAPALGE